MAFDAPVLEDFTVGADVNPISNDSDWAIFNSSGGSLRIESTIGSGGGVVANAASAGWYYYTPVASTETDYEVRIKLLAKPANGQVGGLIARGTPGTSATFDCYALLIAPAAGTDAVRVDRYDNGSPTNVASASREASAGDEYAWRFVGSSIEVWVRPAGGGGDSQIISTSDATYTSGRVGMVIQNTSCQLDDFGWVSLVSSFVPKVLVF